MAKIGDEQLERLAEWVNRLLEGEGAQVAWKQYIPDPDNPRQARQIDVIIERGEFVTHVECRAHAHKQDVKWIEELIGRKASLRIHAMIAVSASGFTEGAILKAQAFGIVIRTIDDLTDDDVRTWGKPVCVNVDWLHFRRLCISLHFDSAAEAIVSRQAALASLSNNSILKDILESVKHSVRDDLTPGEIEKGSLRAFTQRMVNGQQIRRVTADFEVEVTAEIANLPIVRAYKNHGSLEATVASNETESLHIAQFDNNISAIVDVSMLTTPQNCVLRTVNVCPNNVVTLAHVQIIGVIPEREFAIALNLVFSEPPQTPIL